MLRQMEKSLLEQLMQLPPDTTSATIQGVALQIIDEATRQTLLQSDPDDVRFHECILSNGIFIADMPDGTLLALYKVQ